MLSRINFVEYYVIWTAAYTNYRRRRKRLQRIIHIGANYSTFVFKDFKLCIIELNFSFSIETCTHARKLTSRRNRNIYFARGKVHMYVYTFFKATCFWIIMIRIYSLHIIQIFFIRQFFSYFCYVHTTFLQI